MFYNPVYLKKSGKFGLIWIAATQSKVLSRRELATVDVSAVCGDIINHIPGLRQKGSKASRFSLYLSCQLMYGSVKVLQRQWDILLIEVQTLCRRCVDNTPLSTKEIDLGAFKHAVTLDPLIPSAVKETFFDPYFGVAKEPCPDVITMLDYHIESDVLNLEPIPFPVKPGDNGSPNSVTDPRELQIRDDHHISPIQAAVEIPGEKDLPQMDIMTFMTIDQDQSLKDLQEHFGQTVANEENKELGNDNIQDRSFQDRTMSDINPFEGEDRNTSTVRDILMDGIQQTDISMEQRPLAQVLEETPLAKTGSGMPAPPRKPKADKPNHPRDPKKKDSRFQEICNAEKQSSSEDSFLQREQANLQREADPVGHGRDWALKNAPLVDLSPIETAPSPLRKKRPHKLIIDTVLKIPHSELRHCMEHSEETRAAMELPTITTSKNGFEEPGLKYLKHKQFEGLFVRKCKFGLQMNDTGSELDSSLPSPRLFDFLSRKRARGADVDAAETPANKIPKTSEVMSIEQERASANLSKSVELMTPRRSLILADELSRSNISRGHIGGTPDRDISKDGSYLDRDIGALLQPLPEDQVMMVGPVPEVVPVSFNEGDLLGSKSSVVESALNITLNTSIPEQPADVSMTTDSPKTQIYNLVEGNLRSKDDWTTFQAICPLTCSRKKAAEMFFALLVQTANGKLKIRQDEPYTNIFVWVPEFTSGTSSESVRGSQV